jgi:cytochrome b involved in lipid metabolism
MRRRNTARKTLTKACLTLTGLTITILAHAADPALPTYTLEDIAAHASEDSCWMAIEGKVYDVTDHIPTHPAPPEIIVPWCGREATEGMQTKGYGEEHSEVAWDMLEDYLIGTLSDATPSPE